MQKSDGRLAAYVLAEPPYVSSAVRYVLLTSDVLEHEFALTLGICDLQANKYRLLFGNVVVAKRKGSRPRSCKKISTRPAGLAKPGWKWARERGRTL